MNLKELAASLNLSQTTVSRALNGYPEVGAATRARVVAAAKAANYAPNTRARRLATGRSMAIGHVIPLASKSEMVNPIFADFLTGAGEVYAQNGYDMVLSVVGDGQTEEAYRQMVERGTVDAVLVQGPQGVDPRIAILQDLKLPFLVHGRTDDPTGYCWLDIDNQRAFQRAADLLLDLGHRRIALLNGPEGFDFARRRRAGYQAALEARGIEPEAGLIHAGVMTETYGYSAAAALLDGPAPPSAFLVSSIVPAIGVRRAAGERGLRLGRDVSVICHDDVLSYLRNEPAGVHGPGFTATRSSIRAAGRRCAEILLDRIEAPDAPLVQELWEPELTLGQTTGPCPAIAAVPFHAATAAI